MTDINVVTVAGRLTADISERDFSYLQSGTAKLTLHLANNKSRKQGGQWIDETSFFDVTVWGKIAESLRNRVYKGLPVVVSGRLQQDRWQDQNGQNRSKVYIVADSVQTFAQKQEQQGGYQQGGYEPNYQQGGYQQGGYEPNYQQGGFPEDIPNF